ncbi:S8 family serine peptidase [Acaricomes phytoseiuli]|uniref:S8 family serine peptidase n=1 Tax=Acaricomes phytoseiuli TaxID=291968 RepID=UPI00037538A2
MNRPAGFRRILAAFTLFLVPAFLLASLWAAPSASADETRNRQYWLNDYGIQKAWESSKGAGVKVAVIDSGVDGSHKDLKGAVVGGTDVSGSGSSNGQQGLGARPEHGTLVASVLAGRGTGGEDGDSPRPNGVVGVAPEAELLAVSTWLGSPNPSGKSVDEQIPEAVRWAVDNGARVINMSLTSSSPSWPQSWDEAFLYAEERDVVIVAAVGNTDAGITQVGAPATIPGVVAVAGLKRDGTASQGSSAQGITIAVSAPAENLVGALPGNNYADWGGSSGAAPIVSGVAALIRSKYPGMPAAQVINRIIRTAKPAGDETPNNVYGWGILDADATLNADVAPVTVSPLPSLQEWITIHRRGTQPTPTSTATASAGSGGESVPPATAPVAIQPTQLSSPLPGILIIGFGVLLLLVLVAGTVHLRWLRKRLERSRQPAGTDGSGSAETAAADLGRPREDPPRTS